MKKILNGIQVISALYLFCLAGASDTNALSFGALLINVSIAMAVLIAAQLVKEGVSKYGSTDRKMQILRTYRKNTKA